MRRPVVSGAAAALLAIPLLAACDGDGHTGEWVKPLPVRIGVRADAGQLELWTGTPCENVSKIRLTLDPGAKEPVAEVEYVARTPRRVEKLQLGSAPEGFSAAQPLPDSVSWRDAEKGDVIFFLADGGHQGVGFDLGPVADAAGSTGPDEYVLGDRVLSEKEILEGDGGDYALVCSPDPTQDSPAISHPSSSSASRTTRPSRRGA